MDVTLSSLGSNTPQTFVPRLPYSKLYCIATLIPFIIFSGCSSLGGGSVEKRAQKLSTGIQSAYRVSPETANRVSPYIVQSSTQYDIDPLLIAAVIRQESTYRSQVVSPAGAVGLMQIIPKYWQQRCPGSLFNEANNIACGSYILSHYHDLTGNWKKALAYYNVGPAGYKSSWKTKRQGKRYAKQVKQHEKALKKAL